MPRRTLETRELAACLRHDLRDPLGAMTHWLHLLESASADSALRDRAYAGIRSAIAEQLHQIERLGGVLEMAQVLPPALADPQDLSPRLLSQVISAAIARLDAAHQDRIDLQPGVDARILVRIESLADALSSLASHGLRQLLPGERLRVRAHLDAVSVRISVNLQILPGTLASIDQPWKLLADPHPAPSLAVLHARCVLNLHRADMRMTSTAAPFDTLEIGFPFIPEL